MQTYLSSSTKTILSQALIAGDVKMRCGDNTEINVNMKKLLNI